MELASIIHITIDLAAERDAQQPRLFHREGGDHVGKASRLTGILRLGEPDQERGGKDIACPGGMYLPGGPGWESGGCRRAHHRGSSEGWPWRIAFSRGEACLMASSGRVTSISFFLPVE